MTYLLDTDSATLAFAGHARIRARIALAPAPVWLSSIAAEEALRGALGLVNKNRDRPGLPAAYGLLTRLLTAICKYPVCAYDERAAQVYATFPAHVRRVGSQDCRIAASAIANGWTVITANQKDFSRIPGVLFEDWSR